MSTLQADFTSLATLLDYAERDDSSKARAFRYIDDAEYARFSGLPRGTGWPTMRTLFEKGSPDTLARLRSEIASVTVPRIASVRRRGTWADQGDELSRDRLWAGQSDAWRTARRQATNAQPYVRLVATIGGRSNVDAAAMFYSGAATVVLAEAMMAAGYEVEIVAASSAVSKETQLNVTAVVKPFSSPLALTPILATVASSGLFRTAVFAARQNMQRAADERVGGSVEVTLADVPPTSSNVRTIIVPRVLSRAAANAAVIGIVRELEGGGPAPAPSQHSAIDQALVTRPRTPQVSRPAAPASVALEEQEPSPSVRRGDAVTYRGERWIVGYAGPTKFGAKIKLIGGPSGGGTIWCYPHEVTA